MNLLISGAWQNAKENIEKLEELGHKVFFMQNESELLPCDAATVDGIIANGIFLHHPIESFSNLKYVQLTSAGYDRVPMDYAEAHNITVRNAKGVYSIPMSEYAVSGVLQLYKNSQFFADNKKAHRYEKDRSLFELYGKTVCIVGCGSVGGECAKRFKAFGCEIIGVDEYVTENTAFDLLLKAEKLTEAMSSSDIVVLTLPLTDDTYHLIDKEKLSHMKNTTVLVNIARGAIIDTDALIEILPTIKGAVIDVFEEEPLRADSPLWDFDNVVLTPHNSFVGEGNAARLDNVIFKNLEEFGI